MKQFVLYRYGRMNQKKSRRKNKKVKVLKMVKEKGNKIEFGIESRTAGKEIARKPMSIEEG